MCYHQARGARFIGHCWGRRWRDATDNLLQTSIINGLGTFPVRRICGTQKVQLLFFCSSRFRWGGETVVRGGGVEKHTRARTHTKKKQNKQTKHTHQVTRAVKVRLQKEKLTGVIFLCSANKSQPQKRKRPWPLMNEPTL